MLQIAYEWTTRPREPIPPVIATAHDDKTNAPHGMQGLAVLNINSWFDNYDPEPLITVQNNPLDYNKWFRSRTNGAKDGVYVQ